MKAALVLRMCDTLYIIHDRSTAVLTTMDGGNAENAGVILGRRQTVAHTLHHHFIYE